MSKALYRWIIDKDYTAAEQWNDTGVQGPRNLDETIPLTDEFLMGDSDGESYYEGRIGGTFDGFEPLDDFGQPNADCIWIAYKNNDGEWEEL